MKTMMLAAWQYRHFILSSIRNDFRVRFTRSRLGGLWMIIHPLSQVLIFALILSNVLAAKLPGIENKYAYALYLMAGILGWSLFSETVSRALGLFIENGNLMKKMAFPRICLPLITTGIVSVNNLLLLFSILAVFALLGHFPDSNILWVPMLMAFTLLLGLGLGLLLGVLNVFIRDIGQVVPIILQALFWLTPIVYNITILPQAYRGYFTFNPLYPLIASFQNVMVFGVPPLWAELAGLTLAVAILLVFALILFRRASAEMVDVL